MDYERLRRAFQEGDPSALPLLSHEARRRGDTEVLSKCYVEYLAKLGANVRTEEQDVSLVPVFAEKFKGEKGFLYYLIRYSQESGDPYYEDLCRPHLSRLPLKQGNLQIIRGRSLVMRDVVFGDNDLRATDEPLYLQTPKGIPLNWTAEVVYLFLRPLLEALVRVYDGACGDKPFLGEAYQAWYRGELREGISQAEAALSFYKKRRKSMLRCRNRGEKHPKVGGLPLKYMDYVSSACRSFTMAFTRDPRIVLPLIFQACALLPRQVFDYDLYSAPEDLRWQLLGFSDRGRVDQ